MMWLNVWHVGYTARSEPQTAQETRYTVCLSLSTILVPKTHVYRGKIRQGGGGDTGKHARIQNTDIGLFCIVNEYYLYLERGNYLDENIALQIFSSQCSIVSKLVLEHWGFDSDFVEVATNERIEYPEHDVTYLDIARIANHVLMFRRGDEDIDEHEVEFDVTGADILYRLTTLSDLEFRDQIDEVINACGL